MASSRPTTSCLNKDCSSTSSSRGIGASSRARSREPRTLGRWLVPAPAMLCEVEITSHDQSRDGRYYIEVVGRRSLRCERDWQDNSNLRSVVSELTDDAILPQQESTPAAAAAALTAASINV